MIEMDRFSETVVIAGDECQYDPAAEEAILYCDSCGQPNAVSVSLMGDEYVAAGFVCEHCGAWNDSRS